MHGDVEAVLFPGWVKWLAQDADGTWWGYEVEPLQYHRGWYENELGRQVKLASCAANSDWRCTLRTLDRTTR